MKFKWLGIAAMISVLSTATFAISAPTNCPGLTALKQTPFVSAETTPAFPGKWYVMQKNNMYDTDGKWDFSIIVPIEVNDDTTAIFNRASATVSQLLPAPGPRQITEDFWICEYQLPGGNEAVAFYPSTDKFSR